MHPEIPEIRRCFCCLSLRRGLIAWGYLRLAIDILAGTHFVIFNWPTYFEIEDLIFLLVVIIYLSIDAAFTMFLIVGGHKKNHKLLRITYIYSIIWLVLELILAGLRAYSGISQMVEMGTLRYIEFTLIDVCFFFMIFFVQLYLTLLIRSEAIKLRKQNLEMQFVNHAADAESRCVCADNGRNDDSVQ